MANKIQRSVVLLAFALSLRMRGAPPPWYFLPNFGEDVRGVERVAAGRFHETIPGVAERLLSPDGGLTPDQREQVRWHEATFPHRDFAGMMPQQKAFGWYAHAFGVPQQFTGLDLLLDLGIIDDADETFVNGVRVGGLGKVPGGSAWQADRLYRIPASKINCFGDNLAAVHVWSLWGLGGIVGPPVLSAAIAPADAAWEVAFRAADAPPPEGLNDASDTADAVRICLGNGGMPTPHHASRDGGTPTPHPAEWPENVYYAVYRLPVALRGGDGKPLRFEKSVVLDIGPVFDVAAIYLNNKRIGRLGRFPEKGQPAFTEAAARGRAVVSPDARHGDGGDLLTVVVYRERGTGGLPGLPGLLLHDPLEDVDAKDIASVTEAFNLLLQCGRFAEAEALLAKAAPRDDTARAWLLSHRAHLAFLQWHDGGCKNDKLLDGVLSQMAEIFSKLPSEAPKQSAIQAFCRVLRMAEKDEAMREVVRRHFPAFDGSCTALPDDRMTLGDWQMHYGNRFYVLAAMGQVRDWIGSGKRKPLRYSVKVPTDRDIARYWLPKRQRDLSSPDALLRPAGYKKVLSTEKTFPDMKGIFPLLTDKKIRRASWWDDHGEMHPFDDEGPDLIIRADLDSARSCVSLYMMDYDWRMSSHPRQQSVIVYDSKGVFLNACWEGKIDHGVYARFRTSGISEMAFRICKHRGNCTAVSGLFVDVPPSKPISPMDVQRQESKVTPDVLKVILDSEADFCWEKAMNVFTQELQEMKSPDELGRLLESLASMEDLHPCWLFLSVAKAFETAEKIDTQGKIELLAVILEKCEAHVHYPLRAHALRLWKEYGLPEEHSAVVRYKPIPVNKTDTETQKGEQP